MVVNRPGTKDGAMNETQDSSGGTTATPPPPGPPPTGEQTGPRVSHEDMRDLRRLRRSVSERKIAGVAGGVGRHLDVDPTVIRVLFVVASFFGGAGLLLYAALWLLVPEEGRDSAAVPTRDDTRKILLIVVGVVAALIVLGHAWGNWWFGPGWPIGLVAIAAVLYLVSRDRNRAAATPAPSGPYSGSYPPATYAATSGGPGGTVTAPAPAPGTGAVTGGEPPAGAMPPAPPRPSWSPPPYVARPPRPRRQGLKLFWPTLALVAIALGILGLYENAGNTVLDAAYPALALAITGVMLVVGAFVGRPGGLILIGIVSAFAMAVGSATGGFEGGKTLNYSPATSSDVQSDYTFDNAELSLDLSRISDPEALDGDTIRVDGGAGRIEVVLPRNVIVDVDANIRVVGGYTIGDSEGGGFQQSPSTTFGGSPGDPTVHLDLGLRVGEIDVRQQ
jgi:phage shock protein PspC (stress-responsive transcriptional regulator)